MKGIKRTLKLLKLVFKISKAMYIVLGFYIINDIIWTLAPVGIVAILMKYYEEGKEFIYIIIACLIYLAIQVFFSIIHFYFSTVHTRISRKFNYMYTRMFYEKIKDVDYQVYQSSDFLNSYTKVLDSGLSNCWQSFWNLETIISSVISLIAVYSIIILINAWAILYAVIIMTIFILIQKVISKIRYKNSEENKQCFRERGYVRRMFYLKDAAEDIRTTKVSKLFLDMNDRIGDQVIKNVDKYISKTFFLTWLSSSLMNSIYGFTIGLISYVTIKDMNFAGFITLSTAASTLTDKVWNLSWAIGNFQQSSIMADDIFNILGLKSKIESSGTITPEAFEKIELRDVSFSYDSENKEETSHDVLTKLNLTIDLGKKIAIVGENGAGKTTFVKLLLRLYDPSSGTILYNDIPYQDLKPKEIRKHIGAVFQDFQIYAVSVAENILQRKVETKEDEKLVIEALKFCGLYDKIMNTPLGIHSEVTTEFNKDGIEFSGGERQKLAIARVFASSYDLMILDEPSSALDPLAEAMMYNKMLQLGNHKTLIFISHRLSTTINADYIYLFDKGQVIEEGTHEHLMSIPNGKYKHMFDVQAEKYIEGRTSNESN